MTSELTTRTIRRLLEDLIANPSNHRWGGCHEHAKRLGALPVFGDFGGFLFVAPDGRVLSVPDLWRHPEGEAPWPLPLLALAEAARLYPELSELRPRRSDDAADCLKCSGRGHYGKLADIPGISASVHESDLLLCGYCSSLGWIEPNPAFAAYLRTITIETAGIPSPLVTEYAAVPIAFEVTSVLVADTDTGPPFVLTQRHLDRPYVKDYDAIGEGPLEWEHRFDTSQWGMFLARANGLSVGGATIAFGTPGLDVLEERGDLAVLWDIRVAPAHRGRGVGRALFKAAEAWALTRGCLELKIETQNVNVPACRFYAAVGYELRVVREEAYPQCPGEAQFLWYKTLRSRNASTS